MYAKKELDKLGNLLRKMMLLTFLYGIPISFVFYFFAEPLTSLFFENSPAIVYLKLLVPYFLFHYFVAPLQAFLIGIGLVREAFWHAIWSTSLSFILMFFLGSMPNLQMGGIILGMNTGMVLLTLLHYFAICQKIGIDWRLKGMLAARVNKT